MAHPVKANVGNAHAAAVQQNPVERSMFSIECGDPYFRCSIFVNKPCVSATVRDIKVASAEVLNIPIESIRAYIGGKIQDDNNFIPKSCEKIYIVKINQ